MYVYIPIKTNYIIILYYLMLKRVYRQLERDMTLIYILIGIYTRRIVACSVVALLLF